MYTSVLMDGGTAQ